MDFKALPGFVLGWLRRARHSCLLVMMLLGLVLQENYPFSDFPMFSSFSRRTYFIHLADAQGNALPTRQFGLSNSTLKKIFDRYRRKELRNFADAGDARVPRAEAAAGQSLLRYLEGLTATQPQAKKLLPGLQVEHVKVEQRDKAVVLEARTVARHP